MQNPVNLWRRCLKLSIQKRHHILQKCYTGTQSSHEKLTKFKEKVTAGPPLSNFIAGTEELNSFETVADHPPYVPIQNYNKSRKIYIETHGCQMNVSDTEIIYSIVKKAGFEIVTDINHTDVALIMTCAIREGAEQKIWNKLHYFKGIKLKHDKTSQYPMKIGVLGCMAERLKHKLIEKEKMVDIVAGPDSYKDLPNLLSLANEGQKAVNVMLSADETYADIMPVRINEASKSAFVSIMRGCDNMCTFCIVPFTRGRERSRPVSSILDEVKHLSDQGVKEVTLLGQNVNSYRDLSSGVYSRTSLSSGFKTVYKERTGGLRFADLLDKVADINPEMRIRFTSPHPKDFPDDVLHVINEKCNICKLIHLPAQSGNSEVLHRMRRGHTREAYLELVDHIRNIIPGVAFTSDFICGFCEETEEAHQDTLSLMKIVNYEFAYIYPYSMRQKTHAYYDLKDNVPEEEKKRRADEAYDVFRACTLQLHKMEIGNLHLVQVLGPSKRSELDWSGRSDWNTKVIFPQIPIPVEKDANNMQIPSPGDYIVIHPSKRSELDWSGRSDWNTKVIFPQIPIPVEKDANNMQIPSPGDYIVVHINDCSSQVLKGNPLYHTTLQQFYSKTPEKISLCS